MKKPLVLALILAIVTGTTAFAERTLSLGVGYAMNNTNFTNDFGVSQDYSMNGVCVALDTANSLGNLPISFFSSSVLYFPGQLDITQAGTTFSWTGFDLAFDADFCFGVGYTLKIGSPLAIFAGLGVALDMALLQDGSDSFTMMNTGIGANVSARFMFTKNIGVNVTVRDNWCPVMILGGMNAYDYTDYFKGQNAFNVSGGLTFLY